MKFLKKDVSEGNAVAGVIERAALSHPEIAFKFIREGKQVLSSAGDGKLSSAIKNYLRTDVGLTDRDFQAIEEIMLE
jgi:DNA mismatch repair protein MutL